MSHRGLEALASLDKAAQTTKQAAAAAAAASGHAGSSAPKEVELCEEARALPDHIIRCTDVRKLNAQIKYFRCPAWADLPPRPYHFHVTREGATQPALALDRFPYYLFGKSPACDYVLEHPSVSSIHAAVVFHKEQNCFVLVDLRSTNGVRLNEQKIEPERPTPLVVGSKVRFGLSTRRYELQTGKAPRTSTETKRPREAEAVPVHTTSPQKQKATHVSPSPVMLPATTAAPVAAAAAAAPPTTTPTTTTSVTVEAPVAPPSPPAEPVPELVVAAPAAPPPAREPRRYHLFQLVIKHKDVQNPKARRSGEVITRPKKDAFELAQSILTAHKAQGLQQQQSWTLETFIASVLEYCESTTTKKKGDLGIVEEGTYGDAFDAHVFELQRGQVSEPFETPLGIHLVYRCD